MTNENIRAAVAMKAELERMYKNATTWHRMEEIGAGQLQALIAALNDLAGVAEGTHCIVPVVPTQKMIDAGLALAVTYGRYIDPDVTYFAAPSRTYRAMISKAQEPT